MTNYLSSLYYEDQREEALRKSKHYIAERLPKFLGYFQRVLQSKASGDGPWLYAGRLTYADLVLFQVCPCIYSYKLHHSPPPPHIICFRWR